MTLVDSNILLDIFVGDPRWLRWSLAQFEQATIDGPVLINDVVYAESSARFRSIAEFNEAIRAANIIVAPIPQTALFLAGKAFVKYRRAGGTKTGVLPDFFIGAHAEVERLPLLTRDTARYRTYFPKVNLIAPEIS